MIRAALFSFCVLVASSAFAFGQSIEQVVPTPVAEIQEVWEREVWLVSARTNGACDDSPRLAYWRYEGGAWVRSSREELCAGPPLPTCVWSHGNWVSHYDAAVIGWRVFEQFKRCQHDRPFRMIIWSWPTDRHGKVRKDAQTKWVRADQYAYPLAWLINQFPAGEPVSLVGFSYGAKLNAGALHLLGGGGKNGRFLDQTDDQPRPVRGIFLAAAMDNFSLAPEEQNGFALPFAQRIVNLYNARDKVLDFYPLLWRWHGPKAAGRTGLVGYGGPFAPKVIEMNVAPMIGPKHEWDRYFYNSGVLSRIVNQALFADMISVDETVDMDGVDPPTISDSRSEINTLESAEEMNGVLRQSTESHGPVLTSPAGS